MFAKEFEVPIGNVVLSVPVPRAPQLMVAELPAGKELALLKLIIGPGPDGAGHSQLFGLVLEAWNIGTPLTIVI